MSKFDQRMQKPKSNLLYCQIIPQQMIALEEVDHTSKQIKQITMKLFKGQELSDKTRQPISIMFQNQFATIQKQYLNFHVNVPIVQNEDILLFKIFGINQQPEAQFFIGQCKLEMGPLVNQFNSKGVKEVRKSAKLNQKVAIQFSLFMQKSRFLLEKYVRTIKEKSKILNTSNKSEGSSRMKVEANQVKLQFSIEEDEFIQPAFKIQKNNKIHALKSSNHLKQSTLAIVQQNSFVSKSCNTESIQKGSRDKWNRRIDEHLSKEEKENQYAEEESDILKSLDKDEDEEYLKNKSQLNQDIVLTETKSIIQSPANEKKQIGFEKVGKGKKVEANQKKPIQKPKLKPEPFPQENKANNKKPDNKLFYLAFFVLSVILLLNAMSPSKKI